MSGTITRPGKYRLTRKVKGRVIEGGTFWFPTAKAAQRAARVLFGAHGRASAVKR